jgi:hypothetical protein
MGIRIRIWNADPDPGAWKLKYIFLVKILLFVTLKSDQDPDPHGSAMAS